MKNNFLNAMMDIFQSILSNRMLASTLVSNLDQRNGFSNLAIVEKTLANQC
jgi:hypothetical protein